MLTKKLTDLEIKELKLKCRMGYILPFFAFTIGTFVFMAIIVTVFYSETEELGNMPIVVGACGFVLSVLLSYKMNYKLYIDIRNKHKVQELKIIQMKESKKDWEAGSGTLYIGQEMNGFESMSIIVDNYRYRVDKEIYMNCEKGDEIYFNYGPKSKYMLGIELKEARL